MMVNTIETLTTKMILLTIIFSLCDYRLIIVQIPNAFFSLYKHENLMKLQTSVLGH